MSRSEQRRQFFANSLHRELFIFIFLAAFIPVLVSTLALFYLIFNITAQEIGFPEAVATTILPAAQRVIQILLFGTPVVIAVILFLAYKITHKIIGPFDRIVRELEECLAGQRSGPIGVRAQDKFASLVEKINLLLARIPK